MTAVLAAVAGLLLTWTGPASGARAADPPPTATTVGDLTGFAAHGAEYDLTAGAARIRVDFVRDDTVRIRLAPDGTFTDPTGTDIVLPQGPPPHTSWHRDGDTYRMRTAKVTLLAHAHPLRFELRRADGAVLWSEAKGLTWDGGQTTQTLRRGATEQFYGAGMQNGRGDTSHRDHTVQVGVDYDWNDGGHPNSVPFYLSSAGYGVFRDTYAPGTYAFTDPVTTTEQENRFDAYYFAGDNAKQVIGAYTALTGRPFLPPLYGLEVGDSDCYLHNANRGERHTLDALKVADGYLANDMPLGWMLVNDGYGCGYENLPQTARGLRQRGAQLGMWTQDGLATLAQQVKDGQRVAKLDVAWVGDGYKFALDGCKAAYQGIEDNSDARGFTWAPESWSGAQRCGVQWSGDQSGGWDYIRWQIPTYAGATMSGLAYTTGDIDGIFGGSPQTYTRDLEWKSFLPTVMSMDGWAPSDKQPFRYGEPYTSVNRRYLKLKEALLPYLYTYAEEAHRTGVGPVRPLALEYPGDPVAAGDAAKYEFLSGQDFLVAPVYQDSDRRDGIYLPKGTWTDYWSGRVYRGPVTVDGYSAPLDTLPLFVRAGAAIPMWQGIRSYRDHTPGSTLTWDVYPQGESSFTLYEDDGVTRQHRTGAYARQRVDVRAPRAGSGDVTVAVGASTGHYQGKAAARGYELTVHTGSAPAGVTVAGRPVPRAADRAAYQAAERGWWYDPADRQGVVHVKTGTRSTGSAFTVRLRGTSALGGRRPGAVPAVTAPDGQQVTAGTPGPVAVQVAAGSRPTPPATVSLTAPHGWTVSAARTTGRLTPGTARRLTFTVTPPRDAPPGESVLTATVVTGGTTVTQCFAVTALPPPPDGDTWASDMVWLRQTNGWGPPERDRSNGESGASDGHPLTLRGTVHAKGIGAHADSDIAVNLGGRCISFTAEVGIDDETAGHGDVTFTVTADGRPVWTSPALTEASATVPVDVALTGARVADLRIDRVGTSNSGDHGDWAAARFHCRPAG
ncbi:glycoside hydrolase family protein [Streptantibioticus cattleyicolor NRRL 8057 = DSM 46488]|uniref:Glycoside hydrolase family protein n=1 Tax=Streptantibioticus cattleyicolor (strain ATCC 35852 / DSM 46488 / JCM 4925 / NBRC 14057 / NRRL 8057) TaxID=1003195 RepID=F8K1J6_STREN|nr:glycoside hydrolase family protein [Streptantibioticus cattleyicolor NRRL 8057 = DSM 46488]MYS61933.1 DUF5110 domain-containing protein [Streptomyces sp. SID5468]CCB77824.1 conserved exported protein of unknown function [Streptantibioticus cattleyicolor NRRL 8057 = DSM 46488]